MIKLSLVLILFMSSSFGQDEREFRKLFSKKELIVPIAPDPKLIQESIYAEYDLDGDKKNEYLQVVKKDGINFFRILDNDKNLLKELNFQAKGIEANLYKLRSTFIKPGVLTILFYFDEGYTKSVRFKSTARIYFLSIIKNDWDKAKLTKGPSFFVEHESSQDRYYKRPYHVNFVDYNQDGTKEIAVTFGQIQRIFLFHNNDWKEFL